jgi:glycosyltransferase involved in cell wall biosynthesis
MKISLITVSYNSEKTIRETFESVQGQKIEGFDLEYIHVDGLSSDTTMNISEEFDDIITKRISEKDSGIYNAMNKGIHIATGDVIGFLNSDDTFSSNRILLSIAEEFFKRSDLDIVFGNINYINHQGQIKRKWRTGPLKSFTTGFHPPHPAFYAKSELFKHSGGFNEQLTIAADFELMLRFVEAIKTKSQYIDRFFVDMKLGGASNNSLRNIMKGKKDITKSFDLNGIKIPPLYFVKRYSKKIFQRFNS